MGTAARTSAEQAPDWDPAPAADRGDHVAQHSEFAVSARIRRGISLHPLAVIVAVLAGAGLAGVAGVFLAVPVTVCRSEQRDPWSSPYSHFYAEVLHGSL
jgi:hypothetical protein